MFKMEFCVSDLFSLCILVVVIFVFVCMVESGNLLWKWMWMLCVLLISIGILNEWVSFMMFFKLVVILKYVGLMMRSFFVFGCLVSVCLVDLSVMLWEMFNLLLILGWIKIGIVLENIIVVIIDLCIFFGIIILFSGL